VFYNDALKTYTRSSTRFLTILDISSLFVSSLRVCVSFVTSPLSKSHLFLVFPFLMVSSRGRKGGDEGANIVLTVSVSCKFFALAPSGAYGPLY